jgi:hypothetical protein
MCCTLSQLYPFPKEINANLDLKEKNSKNFLINAQYNEGIGIWSSI